MKTQSISEYRENRAKLSAEELRRLQGRWVAFSSNGKSIVASAPSLAELFAEIDALGMDVQDVVLERIESDEMEVYLGGAELK